MQQHRWPGFVPGDPNVKRKSLEQQRKQIEQQRRDNAEKDKR